MEEDLFRVCTRISVFIETLLFKQRVIDNDDDGLGFSVS